MSGNYNEPPVLTLICPAGANHVMRSEPFIAKTGSDIKGESELRTPSYPTRHRVDPIHHQDNNKPTKPYCYSTVQSSARRWQVKPATCLKCRADWCRIWITTSFFAWNKRIQLLSNHSWFKKITCFLLFKYQYTRSIFTEIKYIIHHSTLKSCCQPFCSFEKLVKTRANALSFLLRRCYGHYLCVSSSQMRGRGTDREWVSILNTNLTC